MADAGPVETTGILVLGMHRSGTSCLTGLLETSRVWLGNVARKNKHNPKGNLENRAVRRLNDEILMRGGGRWFSPPRVMEPRREDALRIRKTLQVYEERALWAIKDPRMLLLLGFWRPHLASVLYLGTFRDPISVAQSLRSRDGFPVERGIEIWTAYNAILVGLHRSAPFPLISFDIQGPEYLKNYRKACRQLGLNYNHKASSDFYDTSFVSHRQPDEISLPEQAAVLYEYLKSHRLRFSE